MEDKKLPKNFFEKERQLAPKDSLKEIIPFKFSNNEDIKKGKYKDKILVTTEKKQR